MPTLLGRVGTRSSGLHRQDVRRSSKRDLYVRAHWQIAAVPRGKWCRTIEFLDVAGMLEVTDGWNSLG